MKPHALLLTLTVALVAAPLFAQTSVAESPVWEIHLNVQKTLASPLGKFIMELIEAEEPVVGEKIDEFVEAIGFDPRTEMGLVKIFGNSFEDIPDVTALVDLGNSRGNLEGWILAAPGYESESIDDNTLLHSFNTEQGDVRLWCALPRSKKDNRYVLVASVEREKTIRLAKQVAAEGLSVSASQISDDTLLSVRVNDLSALPLDIDDADPGSGIIKIIQSIMVNVTTSSDTLTAQCVVEADSSARTGQIFQLLTGLKAMIQLAATEDDPDVQQALELSNKLSIDYAEGEPTVSIKFSIEYDELIKMIRENM